MATRGRILLVALGFLAGCIGTDFIDENPTADPELTISPGTGAVIVTQSLQFTGEYRDAFDMVVDSTTITWSSSDPSVATIGSDVLLRDKHRAR